MERRNVRQVRMLHPRCSLALGGGVQREDGRFKIGRSRAGANSRAMERVRDPPGRRPPPCAAPRAPA